MKDKIYIDMHFHSNFSDGDFSPQQLIDIANKNNTKIISIADHDTIDGLKEFKNYILKDMIGIKGVEFSSFIEENNQKSNLHILGYAFDENSTKFSDLLKEQKEKRINAHIKLLKDLKVKFKNIQEEEIQTMNL